MIEHTDGCCWSVVIGPGSVDAVGEGIAELCRHSIGENQLFAWRISYFTHTESTVDSRIASHSGTLCYYTDWVSGNTTLADENFHNVIV